MRESSASLRGLVLRRLLKIVLVLALLSSFACSPVEAVQLEFGDNATLHGCNADCSDGDLACWHRTKDFFETQMLSMIRHYATAQIRHDQWVRRHVAGGEDGMNITEVVAEMKSALAADEIAGDIYTRETTDTVAQLIGDQIASYSDHLLGWVPHFDCPLPCDYRQRIDLILFILSIVCNVALLVAVVPSIRRTMSMSTEEEARKEAFRRKLERKAEKAKGRRHGWEDGRGGIHVGNGRSPRAKGE